MESVARSTTGVSIPTTLALERTPDPSAAPAAVAKMFESIFVSMILKQMRQSLDGESMFGGDKGEVLGGMFDHFMGEHIAKSGGIGIANMVRMQLERRGQGALRP